MCGCLYTELSRLNRFWIGAIRVYPASHFLDDKRMGGNCSDSVGDYVEVDQSFANQGGSERQVLFTSRDELGDYAIMRVKA